MDHLGIKITDFNKISLVNMKNNLYHLIDKQIFNKSMINTD
jgi:hypothetical protein